MAYPTILVNSATGSDSAASGAGPSTALTGSSASTDGTGLVVTLDGSPDLTNVATDGSHAIYLADATAGARNFGKITAKDNTAKTVTVGTAFGLSLSGKSWAIGGKRASIGSTSSKKLFDNNSSSGDALPGWIVEMESAHTETIAATFDLRRSGDSTDGPIILRGTDGAATKPILTFSVNSNCIVMRGTCQQFRDFEMRNTNATKTASTAFVTGSSGSGNIIEGITCNHSTNYFARFLNDGVGNIRIERNMISYCALSAILLSSFVENQVRYNTISNNSSHGIEKSGGVLGYTIIENNIIADNGGNGIRDTSSGGGSGGGIQVVGNVIYGNGDSGIEFTAAAALRQVGQLTIQRNIIGDNAVYGIEFSGAGYTAEFLLSAPAVIRHNGFGYPANTSGEVSVSGVADSTNLTLSAAPFVDAGSGDYNINNDAGGGATLRGATLTL